MYGSLHRVTDFIGRCIPAQGSGSYKELFVAAVIPFLKKLDEIQDRNAWVTLTVHAADGIWVSYRGQRICMILPAQKFLRLLSGRWCDGSSNLVSAIDAETGPAFKDTTGDNDYRQWRMLQPGLTVLLNYLASLQEPDLAFELERGTHPRYFPGVLRQVALEAFDRDGRKCPGVGRPAHRVDRNEERVEFDHILPYSLGGASTLANIQVLCQACNSKKRATAA
ncbi:HNH endonuclease [Mesorhizobium sp. M1252]|uniref:HNH endonuclease n=1 Tax=Mesorhizobium sp. M1252 TaxID=2957073 RepID=UPI003336E2F5